MVFSGQYTSYFAPAADFLKKDPERRISETKDEGWSFRNEKGVQLDFVSSCRPGGAGCKVLHALQGKGACGATVCQKRQSRRART